MKKLLAKLGMIAAMSLTFAVSASAVTIVTNPTGSEFLNTPPPGVEGFAFTTGSSAVSINQLGVYDFGNNGLDADHTISLFNSAGTLLASAIVFSGGSATPDSFQWSTLFPAITLQANTQYVLGASYGDNDPDHFLYGTATLPTGFTLDGAVYADQNGNPSAFPDTFFGPGGFFGPNARLVPDGGSAVALLGFGLAGIEILRRKLRSS
ncbi:MAG: VPDSG-CTERM sorting domain-containing protein [Chthoniobacterales bacterium]